MRQIWRVEMTMLYKSSHLHSLFGTKALNALLIPLFLFLPPHPLSFLFLSTYYSSHFLFLSPSYSSLPLIPLSSPFVHHVALLIKTTPFKISSPIPLLSDYCNQSTFDAVIWKRSIQYAQWRSVLASGSWQLMPTKTNFGKVDLDCDEVFGILLVM